MGEFHRATAAISAHRTFVSVGIEIDHFEIGTLVILKEYESVRTNAKATIAEIRYLLGLLGRKFLIAIID